MNDLKDARAKEKEQEKKQVSLMAKYFEQQRERFDYADTAQWLLDDKCDTDLIYIQEKVSEWSKAAKTDTQKKVLTVKIPSLNTFRFLLFQTVLTAAILPTRLNETKTVLTSQ